MYNEELILDEKSIPLSVTMDSTGDPSAGFGGTSLAPTLVKLGIAVGLLRPVTNKSDSYELNSDWFKNPLAETGNHLKTNGSTIAALLGELLGQLSAGALGIPAQELDKLGVWYPIANPQTKKPTGFFLVSYPVNSADSKTDYIFGLGIMHQWDFSAATGANRMEDITVRSWGLLPILRLGNGGVALALGSTGYPLNMGVEFGAAHDAKLIDTNGFSFNGVRFSSLIDLLAPQKLQLSIEILQLQLPTETSPKDRNLSEIAQIKPIEWLSTLSTLFVSALNKILGQNERAAYLLPALGLSPIIPNNPTRLPLLRWDTLINQAAHQRPLATPFIEWFNQLLAEPSQFQGWMGSLAALMGINTPSVAGAGTSSNPYHTAILTEPSLGELALTMVSEVDNQGIRHLIPGLNFTGKGQPLGSSAANLTLQGQLDLAQFRLSTSALSVSTNHLLDLRIGLTLANKDASQPLFSGKIGDVSYHFGHVKAGVSLWHGDNAAIKVVPLFQLNQVETPNGKYDCLDLNQPGELVSQAQEELYSLVDKALQQLFGITGKPSFGQQAATLFGVVPPTLDQGIEWPDELQPPFSARHLVNSFQNPVEALTDYYSQLITSTKQVGQQQPFYYLVRELGCLFDTISGESVSVSGKGTMTAPWQVPLTDSSAKAALTVYLAPQADSHQQMVLGLQLAPSITFGQNTELNFIVDLQALSLILPTTTGNQHKVSATLFPGLSAQAKLPQPFTTPTVAGAALSIDSLAFTTQWINGAGWHWNLSAGQPTIEIEGSRQPVGQDMTFSDSDSLDQLVTKQAQIFAPIVTRLLGVALYRTGITFGLATNAILGLLPNLSSFVPAGLTWPAAMPTLKPTGFSDPVGDIKRQLSALLANPDFATAALSLLSYSLHKASPLPSVRGTGHYDSPYAVPIGLPGEFNLAVWTETAGTTLGLGLQRQQQVALSDNLQADTQLTLKFIEQPLTGTAPVRAYLPGCRLQTRLTLKQPLQALSEVEQSYQLQQVLFGLTFGIDNGKLAAEPLVELQVKTSTGNETFTLAALKAATSEYASLFYSLLNTAVNRLITPHLASSAISNCYQVLELIGLTLPVDEVEPHCAINTSGWLALTANPLGYLQQQGRLLFIDPAKKLLATTLLENITGIKLPNIPLAFLQVMSGLKLLESQQAGFAPRIYDWIALVTDPAAQLSQRVTALMEDQVRRNTLIESLTSQLNPVTAGPFQLDVSQGKVIQLAIMADKAPALGKLLQLTGSAHFDLRVGSISTSIQMGVASLGVAVAANVSYQVGQKGLPAFITQLQWGTKNLPAPIPLTLYPFNSDTFLKQATVLAPRFALATFFTQVVDARLLKDYPLSRTVLTAFGLAFEDTTSKQWYSKSPLGLFTDPLAWLLNDAVVGQQGQLNIAALQRVLATAPTVTAASGLGVKPVNDGISIVGLPYKVTVDIVADTNKQQFSISPSLSSLQLAGGKAQFEKLVLGITLGQNFQPGFKGSATLNGQVANNLTLKVTGGYDQSFYFSAGELGTNKPTFQILPFPGWQTLLLDAGKELVQQLLQKLTPLLLDQLAKSGAEEFVTQLRNVSNKLDVPTLVETLINHSTEGADAVAAAALHWLSERLSVSNGAKTTQAIVALMSPYLGGISAQQSLIQYTPSASLPVTLLTGVQTLGGTRQLGLWVALALPSDDILTLSLEPTGIGIEVSDAGLPAPTPVPLLNFQFSLLAPIEDDQGPKISMQFDTSKNQFVVMVDPAGSTTKSSDYRRELLPQFFGTNDSSQWGEKIVAWLQDILINIIPRYASILVLNQTTVKQWLDKPLFTKTINSHTLDGPSAAKVLLAAQLLREHNQLYLLNSIEALKQLTIESFLGRFLIGLLGDSEFLLVPIGSQGGGIWLGPPKGVTGKLGMRVMIPAIDLKAVPYVTFQLGDADAEWIKNAGGDDSIGAGVSVYFPVTEQGPDFNGLTFGLVNLGLDFHGKENQNLVDLSRFSMQAIKPRGLITFDFSQQNPVSAFGGAVTLDNIGISLVPNKAVTGSKVNPVAQNLLGSGQPNSPQQDNPATNPGFSVRASYVSKLSVELFNDDGSSKTQLWFPVQRSFGPIHANKIGVGWQQPRYVLQMLFDGNVSLAGLFVGLTELSVGVPVKTPLSFSDYELDLQGLELSFKGGAVELAGGFLKSDNPLRYDGQVQVKAAKFGLTAVGSYALIPVDPSKPDGDKAPSLFIFANLNIPLGPHPAFFITGLAGGMAYNRNLIIPEPGEINTFPLVQGAVSSSVFGGQGATPESALEKLSQVVYPEIGQYWVAAGIQFTSFEMLKTFAMLVVRFGKEFAIDLIGVSSASLPPQLPPNKALAYVELGLVVSFHPKEGVFSARAQLTSNSFVLAKDCRLTGGFAAVLWFSGEHSGDFVITLGGYHPAFKKPANYPTVPRLGFNWPFVIPIGSLTIDGQAYFALTPSSIMAGGMLKVLFQLSVLRAWFDAGVNFLIQWDPLFFDIEGHVSVGAAFQTTIAGVKISLSAELGAKLHIYGPPFAGEVKVNWYVISFSIPFGSSDKPSTQPLEWDRFQERFLPPLTTDQPESPSASANTAVHPELLAMAANVEPAYTQSRAVLKFQVETGLLKDVPDIGWIVQPSFLFHIDTVIPASTLTFTKAAEAPLTGPAIGIRPMQQQSVTTPLVIGIQSYIQSPTEPGAGTWVDVDLQQRNISTGSTPGNSPEALWSKQFFNFEKPEAGSVKNTLISGYLKSTQPLLWQPVGPMSLATLAYVEIGPLPLPFAWTPKYPAAAAMEQSNRLSIIAKALLNTQQVIPKRNAIYAALRSHGQPAMVNPNLSILANNIDSIYQSPPSLAALGVDLAPVTITGMQVKLAAPQALAASIDDEPKVPEQLLGMVHSYRSRQPSHTINKAGVGIRQPRIRSRWVNGTHAPQANTQAGSYSADESLQIKLHQGNRALFQVSHHCSKSVTLHKPVSQDTSLQDIMPVHVSSFNQYHELTHTAVLDHKQSVIDLPEGTSQVCVQGVSDSSTGMVGWSIESEWTRTSPCNFMGDGYWVRPQAVAAFKPRHRGQVSAEAVLHNNQVLGRDGVKAGWIETTFLQATQAIAVLVKTSDQQPTVQICATSEPAKLDYSSVTATQPAKQLTVGDETLYFYHSPSVEASQQVCVLVHSEPGNGQVQGVFSLSEGIKALSAKQFATELHCYACSPHQTVLAGSHLSISNK